MTTPIRRHCSYPWTDLYIAPDGQAFPCCHREPRPIGNILWATTDELLAGDAAREVRRQAMDGTLPCLARCSRAPHLAVEASDDAIRLERLHVNLSFRCDLRCIMCHQDRTRADVLDVDAVIANVGWDARPHVLLQGGEPTLVPEALTLARHAVARRGCSLSLLTNGLHLGSSWRDVLLQGTGNECVVSLNGATASTHEAVNRGSSWDRVLENLRRLARKRRKARVKTRITLRMTVVPENIHEMAPFVDLADREGYVDVVRFGWDKRTVPRWVENHETDFRRLVDELMDAARRTSVRCKTRRIEVLTPGASRPSTA